MGVPGLKIVAPATPADAKALLRAAIRDDNPVVFFEHKRLYGISGDVDGTSVAIGAARLARTGTDVTIVSAMNGVHGVVLNKAGGAVERRNRGGSDRSPDLAAAGSRGDPYICCEDEQSRRRGGRASNRGRAGEGLASVTEEGLGDLDDAWRITTPDSPIPYSPPLEDAHLPGADRIATEISRRLGSTDPDFVRSSEILEPSHIGPRLRAERERQGLSVREIARRIGVSASLVSQIERDKVTPSVSTLWALVRELNLSMGDLFDDDEGSRPSSQRFSRTEWGQSGGEYRRTIHLASGVTW